MMMWSSFDLVGVPAMSDFTGCSLGFVMGALLGRGALGLIDRISCLVCIMGPLMVSSADGQYLVVLVYVRPGQVA